MRGNRGGLEELHGASRRGECDRKNRGRRRGILLPRANSTRGRCYGNRLRLIFDGREWRLILVLCCGGVSEEREHVARLERRRERRRDQNQQQRCSSFSHVRRRRRQSKTNATRGFRNL